MSTFRIIRRLRDQQDVDTSGAAPGDALVLDMDGETWVPGSGGGGGGGGNTTVDYLVGTAAAGLSAEIVVGTSPGGELGGTWASPTVDATHSGSSHASVQSAAEATAAAALSSHAGDTTAIHGIADTSVLLTTTAGDAAYQPKDSDLTAIAALTTTSFGRALLALADQAALLSAAGAAAASHVHAGEDITSGTVADARIASTIARDSEVTSAISALSSVYQPLDSDLTAIAALTTTSYGRAFLALADAAAGRTALGLGSLATQSGTFSGTSSGTNTGDQTSVSGNAGTATALATPRNIDGQAFDGTAAITVIAPGTHAASGKTTPVDADELPLVDSAASNVLKKLTWANVKATLKTYFDTLYAAGGADGWIAAGETWTYASADAPTFTFTIAGVDLTTKYAPGMRIKLTQTTVKYFIITAVSFSTNTTITIYGGTDYTLANASITSPFWSMLKAPFGLPLDPAKWTVEVTDANSNTQASPATSTYYNPGSLSISVPIGCWFLSWQATILGNKGSAGDVAVGFGLSTANNTAPDQDMSGYQEGNSVLKIWAHHRTEKTLTVAAKTSYFLVVWTDTSTLSSIGTYGVSPTGKIALRARCAYL